MLRFVLMWFGLLLLAIINGTIRDFTYLDSLGEHRAHQLSTITLLVLMSVYCYFIFGEWKLSSSEQAVLVGIVWLILTLAFEFLFGHFVGGHSWEKLFAQYNIFSGNLWILIIIWTAILPTAYYKFFEN